jgi:hypothetical protein
MRAIGYFTRMEYSVARGVWIVWRASALVALVLNVGHVRHWGICLLGDVISWGLEIFGERTSVTIIHGDRAG